jgi:hypothetical protein
VTAAQWEKICWKCRSKISIIIDLNRRLRSRAVHCSHGSLHMWWRDCTRGGLRLTNGTSIIINHVDRGVITSARTLHTVTSVGRKTRPPTSRKGCDNVGAIACLCVGEGGRWRRRFEVIVGVGKPKQRWERPAPVSLCPPWFLHESGLAVSVEVSATAAFCSERPGRSGQAPTYIRLRFSPSVTRPPWLIIEIGHYQLFTTLLCSKYMG